MIVTFTGDLTSQRLVGGPMGPTLDGRILVIASVTYNEDADTTTLELRDAVPGEWGPRPSIKQGERW